MKNLKKNSIILILITLTVLVFVLKDDFFDIMNSLKNANVLFMIAALLCFFVGILFEAKAYQEIIEAYHYEYGLKKSYKMLLITKFFNGITPFSSGGQPMQILMLRKDGIRGTKASNIIVQNFIIYQAALVLLGIFAVTYNHFNRIFTHVELLRHLVTLGFIMNTLVMLGLVIISVSSKFNHFVLRKIIWLLDKCHVIKDTEKILEKWEERIDDFHEGTDYLRSNKSLCFRTLLYNIAYLFLIYVMAYFVVIALNQGKVDGFTPVKSIVASAYVLIMGSFVPIPGASGGIEFGYFKFFGNFIKGSLLRASLLIWRTISYYVPMVIGGILFNLHMKRDEKK